MFRCGLYYTPELSESFHHNNISNTCTLHIVMVIVILRQYIWDIMHLLPQYIYTDVRVYIYAVYYTGIFTQY